MAVQRFALAGVARSGASRSNYHSSKAFVAINGVQYATARPVDAQKVVDGSLTITDSLNEAPNIAQLRTKGFVPIEGQTVIITLGSINNLLREFAGPILSSTISFVGTPANYEHALNLIDVTWGLNKYKVTGYYTGSATTIAKAIIAAFAPGYTSINVVAGLPTVDGGITFTAEDFTAAMTRLMKRIDGDWFCDYQNDIHAFFVDTSATDPTILTAAHPTLTVFAVTRDLSQIVTRVFVEGGGSNAAGDTVAGLTLLPVTDGIWYSASGGTVVSGPQRVTYAGLSTVLPSPQLPVTITTVRLPTPQTPILTNGVAAGALVVGGTYQYLFEYTTSYGDGLAGGIATRVAPASGSIDISDPGGVVTPPPGVVVSTRIFRTLSNGAVFHYLTAIPTGTGFTDTNSDASITAGPSPTGVDTSSNLTSGATYKYALTWLTVDGETMIGPVATATTNAAGGDFLVGTFPLPYDPIVTRKVWYRTAANGSTFGKLGQFAAAQDVLTDVYTNGAAPPSASTAGNSTFTHLTGIPASGPGSILYRIPKDQPVNILQQVDDGAAQTALAALLGGDGIQEDYIQDGRLAKTEAIARGTAQLALKKDVLVTMHFQTRDINTRAGRTIRVNLGAPFNISNVDFLIQSVTMSAFAPALQPTYDATASSVRYTFEAFLRSLRAAA